MIPVSAKYGHGVDDVKDWILSKLPHGPPYYPKVFKLLAEKILAQISHNEFVCFFNFFFPNASVVRPSTYCS